MKAVKVIKGGWIDYPDRYQENNYEEIKEFLNGADFGCIINGGGGRKKKTKWAKFNSILVMDGDEPIKINAGEYLVKTDKGYISLTEQEYKELV